MVERYYRSLRQIYPIITIKIPSIEPNLVFQIFFKTTNNSVGLNKLVSTLFVFDAYPRMTKLDAPFLFITHYAMDIKKIMKEV